MDIGIRGGVTGPRIRAIPSALRFTPCSTLHAPRTFLQVLSGMHCVVQGGIIHVGIAVFYGF